MKKRVLLGVIITALILAGCGQSTDAQRVQDELNRILTQSAIDLATAAAQLPDILATDTPAPPSAVDATATATPDAAITISSIQETGPGRAIVSWDAYGNFPFGYALVWTTEQRKPVYPDDTSTYTGDQYARSALMSGVPGYVYIVRVCRTTATGCDIYSDAAFFTFTNFAPTPTVNWTQTAVAKTAIANIGSGGGGGGGNTNPTATSKFEIVSMSASSDLKAQMTWTSDTSPADGFRIFYSTTNQEPKAGSDAYYVIADGKARDAYVDGLAGTTYYYRMCKMDDGACTVYTTAYKFTFPGTAAPTSAPLPTSPSVSLLISTIVDSGVGKAVITWAADGKFPEGFRIVYSSTNETPTLKDNVVAVTDTALRSAEVSGTPNVKYYFRVCKYVDGACTVYSPVKSFKFAAPPEDPAFTLSFDPAVIDPGQVRLTWSPPASTPDGFVVLWVKAPNMPVYPDHVKASITDGAATSYLVTGLQSGVGYHFRLCAMKGVICSAYSSVVAATAP